MAIPPQFSNANVGKTPPSQRSAVDAIACAKRINRTWITKGGLAESTEKYFCHLEEVRPNDLEAVCREAVQAAKNASNEHKDPKPAFYASIFSRATREERNDFLKNHFFTRLLSAEKQIRANENPC